MLLGAGDGLFLDLSGDFKGVCFIILGLCFIVMFSTTRMDYVSQLKSCERKKRKRLDSFQIRRGSLWVWLEAAPPGPLASVLNDRKHRAREGRTEGNSEVKDKGGWGHSQGEACGKRERVFWRMKRQAGRGVWGCGLG